MSEPGPNPLSRCSSCYVQPTQTQPQQCLMGARTCEHLCTVCPHKVSQGPGSSQEKIVIQHDKCLRQTCRQHA